MIIGKNTVVVTPPATEVVDKNEFKSFMKLTGDGDDDLIDNLATAARIGAENLTNRPFITTVFKLVQDDFELGVKNTIYQELADAQGIDYYAGKTRYIQLTKRDVISITSVKIYDTTDTAHTITDYRLDTTANRIYIGDSVQVSQRDYGAIEVVYSAGFGAASAVPQSIKFAIMMYMQNMYDFNRGSEVLSAAYTMPQGAKDLLMPYKVTLGVN